MENRADYVAWVDQLVKVCLPIELQKKLILLQPLTKEEALKFMQVIQLVAQAKGLRDHQDILEAVEKVNRNQLLSHKLERQILRKWDDDDEPTLQDEKLDARRKSSVRESMIKLTAMKIMNSPAGERNNIEFSCFNVFKTIPGSYEKYDSFKHSVDRHLRTYLG